MTTAKVDQNVVAALIGISDADNVSILRLFADPSTHALSIDDGTTGAPTAATSLQDGNGEPTDIAVSSVDNTTVIPLYAASATNALKVNSN